MVKNTPVGNVQLSAAKYFTGASFIQLEKLCSTLQLQICHYDTFLETCKEMPGTCHRPQVEEINRALWELFLDAHGQQQNFGPPASSVILNKWLRGIKNHVYYSSMSSGPEKVAKWTSIINHMQDVHTQDNPIYPKCAHADKVSKDKNKWFQPGSVALYKVEKTLTNKRVLKDVEKLSHHYQTSTLESFHSLVLHFAPKNVVFTYVGMLCRLYLASMHHNENSSCEQATTASGQAVYRVSYPKSKKGEATAKPVRTDPTYNYVAEVMRLVFEEVMEDPESFAEDMRKITIPETLSA
ncbi:uncharacterized protein LOC131469558 [Solea solea]|uniref:uncharacterized protein LOC131469558 n=1 Tax=Solea solea TaxID=90069 RepID=UPI00272AC241|nr:uncharacterized protein LOC131469558 [Solea solea]